jgi:hypoxanthine phosphoribosyltransferase
MQVWEETPLQIEFEIPSWEQIYQMLIELHQGIHRNSFNPDVIVGVSRGGWIPARVLSDLLEKSEIANIKVEFYLGLERKKKEPKITQSVSADVESRRILVVDDVADTGKSLKLVKESLLLKRVKDLKIATLYYKPWSVTLPDFYKKTTSNWVIFPWERKEAFRKVIEMFEEDGKSSEDAKHTLIEQGFDPILAEQFFAEITEVHR